MPLSRSKVTSQGQISIPVEVRRRLGIGPGSIVEWEEEGSNVILRRSGTFSSEDIHQALFTQQPPKPRTLNELKEGVRQRARERYARD
jgi:AbrB family looped-hinge helix DNA binding protein